MWGGQYPESHMRVINSLTDPIVDLFLDAAEEREE